MVCVERIGIQEKRKETKFMGLLRNKGCLFVPHKKTRKNITLHLREHDTKKNNF